MDHAAGVRPAQAACLSAAAVKLCEISRRGEETPAPKTGFRCVAEYPSLKKTPVFRLVDGCGFVAHTQLSVRFLIVIFYAGFGQV